jgi:hypothetical protein
MGQEEARQRDVLEARLEHARTMLDGTRTALRVSGAHLLWELACRPENHDGIQLGNFEQLLDAIASSDLQTRFVACAAVWVYADVEATLCSTSSPAPSLSPPPPTPPRPTTTTTTMSRLRRSR